MHFIWFFYGSELNFYRYFVDIFRQQIKRSFRMCGPWMRSKSGNWCTVCWRQTELFMNINWVCLGSHLICKYSHMTVWLLWSVINANVKPVNPHLIWVWWTTVHFFWLSSLIVCLGVRLMRIPLRLLKQMDYSMAGSHLLLIDLTIYCQTVTGIQTHHKKTNNLFTAFTPKINWTE